jgi:hypothetical protein
MMEETLTDELLGPVWFYNRANLVELGISDEKPRFSIKQEKRLDPQVRANVASVLSGMGVELSLDDVMEQTGMRRPEAGEPTIKGRMPAPDAMGMLGGMDREFGAGIPMDAPDPSAAPKIEEAQDTALNGAQVQAAADIIGSVVQKTMPPGTALRMLVSMFNLPESEARAMIDEAASFRPAAPVATEIPA